MKVLNRVIVAVLCCGLVSCASHQSPSLSGAADTPSNRRQAAERYLQVVPPADLMKDGAEKLAESLPEAARDDFIRSMTRDLDIARLSDAMMQSMVKHFTVAEIDALTQFYGSLEGRSVMKKFGLYMADVMPVMQAEIERVVQENERRGN
jgi:hypothetical protein